MLGQERQSRALADLVIRTSTVALAILSGTGIAFGLWSQIGRTAAPSLLVAAVAALCLGFGLLALPVRNASARLFLLVAALSLAVAFFAGAGAFNAIAA
ncbi:MAG TPA: hypothetical protein VMA98_12820 [Candidatus Acidoferrales bacterium]|nr:hypothetical protein [Candidatus Acidoferrales bacterium]